jgi:hypothetical protein
LTLQYNITFLAEGYYVFEVDAGWLSPFDKESIEIVTVKVHPAKMRVVKAADGTIISSEEIKE